jgi:hypothetical protein
MKIFVGLFCVLFLFGCNKEISRQSPTPQPTIITTPMPEFNELIADTVLLKFKDAGLPVLDEIKYTEETDPNNLLGRPNQYIGKINFSDARIKEKAPKQSNSIEVFKTAEDLEKRKSYTEGLSKQGGIFLQYIYTHKNVLLRLDHKLLPKDATEYEAILKSL